jgi:rRNA metabolism SBDS family protein
MMPEELIAVGEDPNDPGGYFIVNGSERVTVAMEDLAPNRILIDIDDSGTKPAYRAKVFSTTDFDTIARRIIEKGEIHLTAEQRRQMIDEKRRQVITFISRNSVNPQTGHPHPPQRIEMAMEEARINIDPFIIYFLL